LHKSRPTRWATTRQTAERRSALVKRGLREVKLVISDAHDGLRHAITRFGETWHRSREGFRDLEFFNMQA